MTELFYHWQDQIIPVYHFETLASTNQTAWELLQQGNSAPFAVTSARQTAGKGQWGRTWDSQLGGLYLSLLLASEMSLSQSSHLTISIVFGVSEILSCYQIPVQIKWLNDLFLQNNKLGGVLVESHIQRRNLKAVVIGIGLNWRNLVPERGIALKNYLEATGINPKLQLSSLVLNATSSPLQLPKKLEELADLKTAVLTGLLFGYHYYIQQGILAIMPHYETRLIQR